MMRCVRIWAAVAVAGMTIVSASAADAGRAARRLDLDRVGDMRTSSASGFYQRHQFGLANLGQPYFGGVGTTAYQGHYRTGATGPHPF